MDLENIDRLPTVVRTYIGGFISIDTWITAYLYKYLMTGVMKHACRNDRGRGDTRRIRRILSFNLPNTAFPEFVRMRFGIRITVKCENFRYATLSREEWNELYFEGMTRSSLCSSCRCDDCDPSYRRDSRLPRPLVKTLKHVAMLTPTQVVDISMV